MSVSQIISLLNLAAAVCAVLAIALGGITIAIVVKNPPAQLKAVVEEAKFQANHKHRKAILNLDEKEIEMMNQLFAVPDTSRLEGWIGTTAYTDGIPRQ